MLHRAVPFFLLALVALSGCPAGAPEISVTPAELDFGPISVGETASQTVMISNTGDAGTVISFAVTPDSPFDVSLTGAIQIEPGDSRTVFVEASPTAVGVATGSLTLAWSGDVAEVSLTVTGVQSNLDEDEDGYTDDVDCDDSNPDVNPGATEICNGIDDDCEGGIDEGFDVDGDDFTTCGQDGEPGTADDDCDDGDDAVNPNATELCDEADNNCDGVVDEGFDGDSDGYTTCGGDCDDTSGAVNPEAAEECNGIDENCDGVIDDGFDDEDGDGEAVCTDCDDTDDEVAHGLAEVCDNKDNDCNGLVDDGFADADADTFTTCDDCDDGDAASYPGAPQVCDGALDNDCDGTTDPEESDDDADGATECQGDCDDGDAALNPNDADNDGVSTCDAIPDCDDGDASNFPGNVELCDGFDNDCDGSPENSGDVDGDGVTVCAGDCDDNNNIIYPGAPELCDGLDNDCDNAVDQGFPDVDADGAANCVDCDDNDATAFPGNTEVCDAVDNNCDTTVDEGFDGDSDTYYDGADAGCAAAYGAQADCDDGDAAVYPSAPDVCDATLDNDCDGTTDPLEADDDTDGASECDGDCDDGDAALNIADADTDGVTTCDGTPDCDDADITVFPGATETCDGQDEDCDTVVDEGFDGDNDTYFDGADAGCVATYGAGNVDCDDGASAAYPGAPDVCDSSLDNDCDGTTDPLEADDDSDGASECAGDCDDGDSGLNIADADTDGVTTCDLDPDCDDGDIEVFPGATEVCSDPFDMDCDGVVADPCTTCADALDADSSRADGVYTIDPDGAGGAAAFDAYCDMTTDGGGWTLIMRGTDVPADNAALITTYASFYSTNVGANAASGTYRVAGQHWETLADNGDSNDELMAVHTLRKAGGLGDCEPIRYAIGGTASTLSVPQTGSATYIYEGPDPYSIVNGTTNSSGLQVALFSASDDGPQAAFCVAGWLAAPWFYVPGTCGKSFAAVEDSLFTGSYATVRSNRLDAGDVTAACSGANVSVTSSLWYNETAHEYYVR